MQHGFCPCFCVAGRHGCGGWLRVLCGWIECIWVLWSSLLAAALGAPLLCRHVVVGDGQGAPPGVTSWLSSLCGLRMSVASSTRVCVQCPLVGLGDVQHGLHGGCAGRVFVFGESACSDDESTLGAPWSTAARGSRRWVNVVGALTEMHGSGTAPASRVSRDLCSGGCGLAVLVTLCSCFGFSIVLSRQAGWCSWLVVWWGAIAVLVYP